MTELILNTGEFIENSNAVHDVILNRLDLLHQSKGKFYKYDAEEFRSALPLFKVTPIVFANTHPTEIGNLSIDDALDQVDGRLIGSFRDVLVNDNGTLFRGTIHVTDQEANELIRLGKARLSSAFSAIPDENGVLRNIIPNHILVYPAETGISPGDHAALFLNQNLHEDEQNGESMAEEKKGDQLDLVRELVQNQAAKDELQVKLDEQKEMIFNQKTQLDEKDRTISDKDDELLKKEELITNQSKEIESLKKSVETLTTQIEEINTNNKKSRRDRIFNQFLPGTKTAFEDRKEELYDDTKFEDLVAEMFMHQASASEPPTEESGSVDVQNQSKSDDTKQTEDAAETWDQAEVRL